MYVREMGDIINMSWLLIGDFNQPVETQDKCGGRTLNWRQANKLQNLVNSCQLIDLGYQRLKFTWFNCRKGGAAIREWIDRAWCNNLWYHHFKDAVVNHLARTRSDHHPLLVNQLQGTTTHKFRGFYFLESWIQHGDFKRAVEEH